MCNPIAVIAGAVGVGAVKKKQEREASKAFKAGQIAAGVGASIGASSSNSNSWWNRPEAPKGLDGRYRLNRVLGRNQVAASRGVSQLRIPTSKSLSSKSTGKAAKEKRRQLEIT